LSSVIAASGASIKDIAHDRAFSGPDVSAVRAICTVETRDAQHVRNLHRALRKHGFEPRRTA
jgi:threonine dehydratase